MMTEIAGVNNRFWQMHLFWIKVRLIFLTNKTRDYKKKKLQKTWKEISAYVPWGVIPLPLYAAVRILDGPSSPQQLRMHL